MSSAELLLRLRSPNAVMRAEQPGQLTCEEGGDGRSGEDFDFGRGRVRTGGRFLFGEPGEVEGGDRSGVFHGEFDVEIDGVRGGRMI
jgi:hypothetical protein